MAETREIFEQHEDEAGRIRLDRPFTEAEAAAIDAANREKLGGRPGRDESFFTGEEKQPRAKRSRKT